MIASCASRSAVTETIGGKPAAILSDLGQLVDVFDPARRLEHQGFEPRRDRNAELEAQRRGALEQLLRDPTAPPV